MGSKLYHAFRACSIPLASFGLICIPGRAPGQEADKSGPVMVSANVLEEEFRTNHIRITWNENLSVNSLALPSFKVVLTASNAPATISFGEYDVGPPTTITLIMSSTNWHYRSNYFVLASNIRDTANNVMAPNSIIGVTWPGLPAGPLPPSATPRLSVTRNGANGVRISWPTNAYSYALEWTTNVMRVGSSSVAGPWCEVQPQMANPYFLNPQNGTHLIYRLHRTQ